MIIRLFLLISFIGAIVIGAQKNINKETVLVPRETIAPLIADQPNCPLIFENIKLLYSLEGGRTPYFRLKNQSAKIVKSYEVVYLTNGGDGGSWTATNREIKPGEIISYEQEFPDTKIIPSSSDNLDKLKLNGGMKGLIIFMIARVEYLDGTIFEDEKLYANLKGYFRKI